ncbi:uncharacterized protein LOC101863988 [Aplysia californica]|uniref:Uncharacterized protein LOC101863988 n=1 Tax=Aplysia californica TaxID=6500 RepID=A0ABM0JRW7_APLCA|nr:uncharacterized protein LOC101863988 [Aplysia californica]
MSVPDDKDLIYDLFHQPESAESQSSPYTPDPRPFPFDQWRTLEINSPPPLTKFSEASLTSQRERESFQAPDFYDLHSQARNSGASVTDDRQVPCILNRPCIKATKRSQSVPEPSRIGSVAEPSHIGLFIEPPHSSLFNETSHSGLGTESLHSSLFIEPSHSGLGTESSHSSSFIEPSHLGSVIDLSHSGLITNSTDTALLTKASHTSYDATPVHTSLPRSLATEDQSHIPLDSSDEVLHDTREAFKVYRYDNSPREGCNNNANRTTSSTFLTERDTNNRDQLSFPAGNNGRFAELHASTRCSNNIEESHLVGIDFDDLDILAPAHFDNLEHENLQTVLQTLADGVDESSLHEITASSVSAQVFRDHSPSGCKNELSERDVYTLTSSSSGYRTSCTVPASRDGSDGGVIQTSDLPVPGSDLFDLLSWLKSNSLSTEQAVDVDEDFLNPRNNSVRSAVDTTNQNPCILEFSYQFKCDEAEMTLQEVATQPILQPEYCQTQYLDSFTSCGAGDGLNIPQPSSDHMTSLSLPSLDGDNFAQTPPEGVPGQHQIGTSHHVYPPDCFREKNEFHLSASSIPPHRDRHNNEGLGNTSRLGFPCNPAGRPESDVITSKEHNQPLPLQLQVWDPDYFLHSITSTDSSINYDTVPVYESPNSDTVINLDFVTKEKDATTTPNHWGNDAKFATAKSDAGTVSTITRAAANVPLTSLSFLKEPRGGIDPRPTTSEFKGGPHHLPNLTELLKAPLPSQVCLPPKDSETSTTSRLKLSSNLTTKETFPHAASISSFVSPFFTATSFSFSFSSSSISSDTPSSVELCKKRLLKRGADVEVDKLKPSSGKAHLPPCRVCGSQATGFHFGVNSCEQCYEFFRRAIRKKDLLTCCIKKEKCRLVEGTSKGGCNYCRLQRCLKGGMSTEKIKTGRYSQIKIAHDFEEMKRLVCNKETHHEDIFAHFQHSIVLLEKTGSEFPGLDLLEDLDVLEQKQKVFHKVYTRIRSRNCPSLNNLTIKKTGDQVRCTITTITENVVYPGVTEFSAETLQNIQRRLGDLVGFCKGIPGFSVLSLKDRMTLVRRSWLEIFMLGSTAGGINESLEVATGPGGDTFHFDLVIEMTTSAHFRAVLALSRKIQKLQLTRRELLILKVIALTLSNDVILEDKTKVEELNWYYVQCMHQELDRRFRPQGESSVLKARVTFTAMVCLLVEMRRVSVSFQVMTGQDQYFKNLVNGSG